jgi:hypothetical protein
MVEVPKNPFEIGDLVRFAPSERAIGWSWPSFDHVQMHPGDSGVVTRIKDDSYVFLDGERGGFHWECFEKVIK